MLKLTLDRDYKAATYLRLSKEDGDFSVSNGKTESDSISNQRLLIQEYVKKHPEITVVKEYCDDGYTGANFERPEFQRMIEDVKKNLIDCIIVKDLSRFGREYIDSGVYIQKLFPTLGIRFIAINDNYDNAMPGAAENDLILPFKNLMNDSYCRDISIKVRTNLDAKRRSGKCVSPRVCFGYCRVATEEQLSIDPDAAAVVQDIFRWKQEGLSPEQIAIRLNDNGVLSPIEYKKAKGSKQRSAFQTHEVALWSPVAIYRILKDETYTGTLVQGKTTTPNHKVKKKIVKSREEWVRTENAHEAIISRGTFDTVQNLMLSDTRSPVGEVGVKPYSGKIFCADCGNPMIRKTTESHGKFYTYYLCGGNKTDKHSCTSHRISEDAVNKAVLATLRGHIAAALDVSKVLSDIDNLAWENREVERIQSKIAFQEEIIEKNQRLKTGAYQDFKEDFISREEYKSFVARFDQQIREAKSAIAQLVSEKNSVMSGLASQQNWFAQFREYENIQEITRATVVALVDRIEIDENKDVTVFLLHADRFKSALEYLQERERKKVILFGREAV